MTEKIIQIEAGKWIIKQEEQKTEFEDWFENSGLKDSYVGEDWVVDDLIMDAAKEAWDYQQEKIDKTKKG